MTDQWRFTALEFDVLWRHLGRDRLPYPMRFRGEAATEDDFQQQRRAAARRVLPRLDEALHAALSALASPIVRVEVCGFHGRGLESTVRAHAGVSGERAALARQDQGADLDDGGDVVLSAVPAGRVAARIAAVLPSARRGTGRGVASAISRRRSGADGSLMLPAARLGHEEACDEFFARPRTGLGEIGVFAGPALDWRPTAEGRVVQWMDFEDDGRYLVGGTDAVSAVPAGGDEIASEVGRLIGLTRGEA
ncbi:ESX secretion-associated protein EspG [Rhodococcus sp. NPDC059234]|uniref:ESX secretion-associated protein EspG n=1 Tax=Rhodococcus sp. NPDC059234 TaxID=3346781 RepID=UPI00366DCD0B